MSAMGWKADIHSGTQLRYGRRMMAGYLTTPFQKSILADLRCRDRGAKDFFQVSPLVIDCRGDAEEFRSRVGERQRVDIVERVERGALHYVSGLTRPARQYAREKVEERYRLLDKDAREIIDGFLEGWRAETGRQSSQSRRSRADAYGIDIILPLSGVRLSYDLSSLLGL